MLLGARYRRLERSQPCRFARRQFSGQATLLHVPPLHFLELTHAGRSSLTHGHRCYGPSFDLSSTALALSVVLAAGACPPPSTGIVPVGLHPNRGLSVSTKNGRRRRNKARVWVFSCKKRSAILGQNEQVRPLEPRKNCNPFRGQTTWDLRWLIFFFFFL